MARNRQDDIGEKRSRSTGGAVRRAVGLMAFLPVASRVPTYGRLIWSLALDDRTPAARKALLAGGNSFMLSKRGDSLWAFKLGGTLPQQPPPPEPPTTQPAPVRR